MVPESVAVNSVRLYKATHFPDGWQFVKPIITDRALVDSTVLIHQGRFVVVQFLPGQSKSLSFLCRPAGRSLA